MSSSVAFLNSKVVRFCFCAFLCLSWPVSSACLAQEQSFWMPVYPDSDPPPPRTAKEVERLLDGKDPTRGDESTPLRLVLVSGEKDHGKGEHDYPNWLTVWSRLLAEAENTTVDTADEFPSQEQIDAADVLVFYQRGRWNAERAAAIDPFLERGGGLVYIHWAVDGRGGQDEFARRIGLASLGGSIRYRHGELNIDFGYATEHPIGRNLERVRWVDETYWQLTGDPSRIGLLGTSLEDGEPTPQFWTMQTVQTEDAESRVFVSIPGHYMWTFDDPVFRAVLLRGIAWVGKRNVDRFNELITLDARIADEPEALAPPASRKR